jgi:alpha-mannosidase
MTDPADDIRRGRGRYPAYTRARFVQFARRLQQAVYTQRAAVESIAVAGATDRIGYAAAQDLDYRPGHIGADFGPQWATYWVKLTARVPDDWRGRVDLYWDSRSEALLRIGGRTIQGLNTGRHTACLLEDAKGGELLAFDIEVACNRALGNVDDLGNPRSEPYRLADVHIRRFDAEAWDFYYDFEVLRALENDREPPQTPKSFGGVAPKIVRPALDTTWAGRLLHELNRVCNILDIEDRATWPAARAILARLLGVRNGDVVHELSAIGHAHIDTAWLWPIEETWRKCQRSFASAVALMDRYPEFKFACSQAYQYDIIERLDPDLFARIREKVTAGQWMPIGGSWVEPDCNLPSGEAMSRQFLYGQRYFERTFGARHDIFWQPDVFGYAGQLPQLMREAGLTRFLTQKLSWNKFTTPPHHSFHWRGIDGSQVLTHFPPVDSYNAMASVEELRYHAANYKDADRSADALYLFGYGDGGGGPDAVMIETLRRTQDLLGVPRSTTRAPDDFFDRLETAAGDLATIEGELYFEYHRGTYTSQAEVKRLNRLAEGRLQTLEYLATASILAGRPAPDRGEIERLWRVLLVNQFHDILPGSSIAEVYVRTLRELAELCAELAALCQDLLDGLAPPSPAAAPTPLNPIGFPRAEVAMGPDDALRYVIAPPFAAGHVAETDETVRVTQGANGEVRLDNGRLGAVLAADGTLLSLTHHATGREALSGPGNRIVLFDDIPTLFEAWDIDPFALETAREAEPAGGGAIVSQGPLRGEVRFERRLGKRSRLVQTVRLDAASDHLVFDTFIDWKDRQTLVKAVFPISARARHATYETMFGAVERPTHANTDADLAQYEVPGHRWADLSEHGFGVALLSDARYGFSTFGDQLALSLVRGTRSPDPGADLGEHRFAYALYPHAGDWRGACVVAEAARFNRPLLWATGDVAEILRKPLAGAAPAQVVVDTIKPAEDGDGWVVRLYESTGGSTRAHLTFGAPVTEAWLSNTLEDRIAPLTVEAGGVSLDLRGYQVATVRVR